MAKRFFYGCHRKLSILPVLLFLFGWGAYLVGFIGRMIRPSPLLPRWDNYPAIVAVAMGPVVVLAALLQSCLPGTPSGVVGFVTGAAAVVYLVSLGNSSITAAQTLYQYNRTEEDISIAYVSCTAAGSIVSCIAISLLLSLWSYYKNPRRERDSHFALHVDNTSESMQPHRTQEQVCKSRFFLGYVRKLAVVAMVLAFLGWCVMVGGHHHRINSGTGEGHYDRDVVYFDFGQWGACVLPPILLLFALIHAACSGSVGSIMGVVVALLNGLVLTSVGYYSIHDVGEWLKEQCTINLKCDYTVPQNAAALCEIIGAFVFCFFWGSVVGFWPSYKSRGEEENVGGDIYEDDHDDAGLLTPPGFIQHRRSSNKNEDEIQV